MSKNTRYDHRNVDLKWQREWGNKAIYWPQEVFEAKNKYYNLWMFPYPSAEGLHAGHAFASTGSDIYGRYQRMNGKDVFQPIGYDSFGIHSENFAIKINDHPENMLGRTMKNYAKQLRSLGHGYDWTRTVTTSDKDYYKWTQWLFLQMFMAGLAYRKKASVNWCPSCKTVLADEQVVTPAQAGKKPKNSKGEEVEDEEVRVCERCGTIADEKELEQWFFRITDYADRLLENLGKIDWPDSIKTAQTNWIGKKQGIEITYPIKISNEDRLSGIGFQSSVVGQSEVSYSVTETEKQKTGKSDTDNGYITVWTSRPDTNFGATFIVVSPEFAKINLGNLIDNDYKKDVEGYIKKSLKRSKDDRIKDNKKKTGVFTGLFAINQLNNYEMPIWVADFVLSDVGTGAVVGVPGHDMRDFEFASIFDLPVKIVVQRVGVTPRSYLMGADDISDEDLKAIGVVISEKTKSGARKIEIPDKSLEKYKELIKEKLSASFWNEIVGKNVWFLFKDNAGNMQEFTLNGENKDKIAQLCSEFSNDPLEKTENLWCYLAENDWYRSLIIQEDEGVMVNSEFLNGMNIHKATRKMMDHLEEKGWGKRTTSYHLRDWLISRQRYWGPPIPMVYCGKCAENKIGWFSKNQSSDIGQLVVSRSVSETEQQITDERKTENRKRKTNNRILHSDQSDWDHFGWYPAEELPVELPYLEEFKPKGEGTGPLDDHPEFYKTSCPYCGSEAKRETDVSDTFLDSSWYFLAYPMQNTEVWHKEPSLQNSGDLFARLGQVDVDNGIVDPSAHNARSGHELLKNKIVELWLPVDLYFGGAEHAVLHLMYARFVTMILNDLDCIDFDEPFPRFYAHGLMIKDGFKMSKSKGNVVNPDEYIEKYGADTLRLYLMFMGPMDGYPDFRDTGVEGMRRFVDRVWDLYQNYAEIEFKNEDINMSISIKVHQTIKKVTEDVEKFQYNTSIAAIMELVNLLRDTAQSSIAGSRLSNSSSSDKRKTENGKLDSVWNDALRNLALLLAPFAPHLTEEVWCVHLDEKFSIHKAGWPQYDKELIREEKLEIVVQVNGRTRSTVTIDRERSDDKESIVSLAKVNQNVSKWLKGEQIKDIIYVPGKIVNFVLG